MIGIVDNYTVLLLGDSLMENKIDKLGRTLHRDPKIELNI